MRGLSAPQVLGWLATGAAVTDQRMIELSRALHHSIRQSPPSAIKPRPRLDQFDLPEFVKADQAPEHATPAERRAWYLVHSGKLDVLASEFPQFKKRRNKP